MGILKPFGSLPLTSHETGEAVIGVHVKGDSANLAERPPFTMDVDDERTSVENPDPKMEMSAKAKGKKRLLEDSEVESEGHSWSPKKRPDCVNAQLPTPVPTPSASFVNTSSGTPSQALFRIFDYPASPTNDPSTSSFHAPSTSLHPASKASPSRSRAFVATEHPIPLERLHPAGTILLPSFLLPHWTTAPLAEDGWTAFSKDLVVEPVSTSPTTARPAKRRKTRTARRPSTTDEKDKSHEEKTLARVVECVQAVVLRATVKVVDARAILRIYLVPQDLEDLKLPHFARRPSRRPASVIWPLFTAVRRVPLEWDGIVDSTGSAPTLVDEPQDLSLLEIYHAIETPSADGFNHLACSDETKDRLYAALEDQPPGVQTTLYDYQRASVAKMLARELAPAESVHPRFRACTTIVEPPRSFWISLSGDVANEPIKAREPKAGILAEDMGVGKTLIVLALVMSTQYELPDLDGTSATKGKGAPHLDPVVLTKDSAEFPFEAEARERQRIRPRVPERLPFVKLDEREERELQARLAKQHEDDDRERRRTRRLPSLRQIALQLIKTTSFAIRDPANAAVLDRLAVVDELAHDPPFYRVVSMAGTSGSRAGHSGGHEIEEVVVAATTLIVVPNELVRQWKAEIDKHIARDALKVKVLRNNQDVFPSESEMATYDVVLMSATRFISDEGSKPLNLVHWKRLVIDEGNNLSGKNLTVSRAENLRCESRWAVSGTPSTNLRGADVDGQLAAATIAGGNETDLSLLGRIFHRFFRHPSFPKDNSLKELVVEHARPDQMFTSRIASTFSAAIIRHPTSSIKAAIELPPLSVKVTYLEMEEAERKMYNALLAIFSSNSIQSQQTNQDYFFHSSNTTSLNALCTNLATASTFFTSDEINLRLREGRRWAIDGLKSSAAQAWSQTDRDGLDKAGAVMQEAYSDEEWLLTTLQLSAGAEVVGVDDEIVRAVGGLTAGGNPTGRTILSLQQLVRIRQALTELRHADVKAWSDDEELTEELITFLGKWGRWERDQAEAKTQGKKANTAAESPFKIRSRKRSQKEKVAVVPLPTDSSFSKIQLVRTTSAKYNYLLDQFRTYPNDKFIVFSSSNPELLFANLSEALDLFGIKHTIIAGTTKGQNNDPGLKMRRFNETSAQECQVILIKVDRGGRGIGLTAASRVVFLEPVWKPDLELQATKRAHRLGQTKPVSLEILIVKGTYEDALFERRKAIAPEDFAQKVKTPQQDASLRTLLQSAKYLEPAAAARQGRVVSKALVDPPVYLIRDEGHDLSND
ncbi:hypothetical protein JCM10212_001000 [Sporobolomyces blumeae]